MCILPPNGGSNLHLLYYRIDAHNLVHQVRVFPRQIEAKAIAPFWTSRSPLTKG